MVGSVVIPVRFDNESVTYEFELVPFYKVALGELVCVWISAVDYWAVRKIVHGTKEIDGLALFLFFIVSSMLAWIWPLLVIVTFGLGIATLWTLRKSVSVRTSALRRRIY